MVAIMEKPQSADKFLQGTMHSSQLCHALSVKRIECGSAAGQVEVAGADVDEETPRHHWGRRAMV